MFDQSRSTLAGVPAATLQTWLTQAQTALMQLQMGGKPISVAYTQGDGSKSVTYTQASLPNLTNWILLLNTALGNSCAPRRPLRPYFR